MDVLTDTTEKSHHEERQQALLDMLSAGALDYLEDEVKLKAQNVGFYRLVLLPKLFWPTARKNCSCDRKKLLKFEAEQFIQTVKAQNNFSNRILF